MKRRSKASGKAGRAERRKAATPKRSIPRKAAPSRLSTATGPETEIARLSRERDEALEQQKATAEVLRVISASPGDLKPVFQTMLASAVRICAAKFGIMFLYDNNAFDTAALFGAPTALAEYHRQRGSFQPPPGTPLDFLLQTKEVVHTADLTADPVPTAAARLGGARSHIAVPMLKEHMLIGAIILYRQEVQPFADKQIELLKSFAAQAVIAIENTRLLNELRESLQRQTATADVLRVISSSPGDLEPVFDAMLQNAVRICEANFGNVYRWDGDSLRLAATHNTPAALADVRRQSLFRPSAESPLGRVVANKEIVQVRDILTEKTYLERDPGIVAAADLTGMRTYIAVPMLKEAELVGILTVYRQEVRSFTGKQIELVKNFADQAVIAIENTRLLNELRQRTEDLTESLEQQTATSEVLRVISSSPGELEPVFQAMLENATRICDATFGVLYRYGDDTFDAVAHFGVPPALAEFNRHRRLFQPDAGTALDRLLRTKEVVRIADDLAAPTPSAPSKFGGARTLAVVPMLKENVLVGAISISRQEVRPFTDKQIALVQNFAAQAVIAIENTRLLNELRQRTADLSKSLEDLRTAQDRLVQTQKLASLGQLTAGIAHEIKNPLNFVNNFSGVSVELIDELQETLGRVTADDKTRGEITELTETLRDNLDKIVQHGKRADSIVKNMLLHSREGSGERRPVDVNALVEESLNLAYHGARAETQGFNVTLERSFDPTAGEIDVFPQEITRVLLNLISNGFYAATKRQGQERGNGFEPTITAATKSLGDRVEIRIRDNGIGIPSEVREKMFNPFFTTKPAGEGTGLGLSISHDIIVKQHSGSIEVDTEPGEFTEFRIILPRTTV
jgi:two-component system NtrC family sensor kinase